MYAKIVKNNVRNLQAFELSKPYIIFNISAGFTMQDNDISVVQGLLAEVHKIMQRNRPGRNRLLFSWLALMLSNFLS